MMDVAVLHADIIYLKSTNTHIHNKLVHIYVVKCLCIQGFNQITMLTQV